MRRNNGDRESLHFVYVDLPPHLRRWKRGTKGLRLYYLIWQVLALRRAQQLMQERRFDLVWHVTLANAWIGTTAGLLGLPLVYGPVGGGVSPPWSLLGTLGVRGCGYELARATARICGRRVNPLARISWRRARMILALNEQTRQWLPRPHRARCVVFPHAVLDGIRPDGGSRCRPSSVMLFAGRLLAWKGVSLAVRALKELPGWSLVVCGDGPDRRRLEELSSRLGVDGRVEFRGWVARSELQRVMRTEATVFVFPSLHDDSPFAVVEALSAGLPVVCLDRGGPSVLANGEFVVQATALRETVRRLAQTVVSASGADPRYQITRAADFLPESILPRLRNLMAVHVLVEDERAERDRRSAK